MSYLCLSHDAVIVDVLPVNEAAIRRMLLDINGCNHLFGSCCVVTDEVSTLHSS